MLALALVACGGGDSGRSGSSATTDGSPSSGAGAEENAAPLKVSGGDSAQFKVKGGDNSVQEYGSEGDESELRQAAETVHAFYVASAGEEWTKACSYLAASEVKSLEQLGSQSPQLRDMGCAPILAAFSEPLSPELQRNLTTVDAASLRHEGEQAFLLYTGPPGKTVYAIPLRLEGGEWKVSSLSASALPGVPSQ